MPHKLFDSNLVAIRESKAQQTWIYWNVYFGIE